MSKSIKRSTARITGFRAFQVVFNRNGICGRSFHTVRFMFDDEGRVRPNMMAIIPSDPSVEAGLGNGTECFVVDMNDPNNTMRGDNFINDVLDAIKAYDIDSQRAFRAAVAKK